MRVVFLAVPTLLAASPALAQRAPIRADDLARVAQSPVAQDAAAALIDQLADIVLDTRVGPAATLVDPRARASDTLRQVQERDDPRYEQHLRADTRRMVGTAGAVAGGAAVEAAELRRTADRLRAAIGPLADVLAGYGAEERPAR